MANHLHFEFEIRKACVFVFEIKNTTNQVEDCDGGCFNFVALGQVVGQVLEKQFHCSDHVVCLGSGYGFLLA